MNTPRYLRAKLTTSGENTDVIIEEVQQVVRFIDGYPSPSEWEKVRDLTEEEANQLGISLLLKEQEKA